MCRGWSLELFVVRIWQWKTIKSYGTRFVLYPRASTYVTNAYSTYCDRSWTTKPIMDQFNRKSVQTSCAPS